MHFSIVSWYFGPYCIKSVSEQRQAIPTMLSIFFSFYTFWRSWVPLCPHGSVSPCTGACRTTHQRDLVRVQLHCETIVSPVRQVITPDRACRRNLRSAAGTQLTQTSGWDRGSRSEQATIDQRQQAPDTRTNHRHQRAGSLHLRSTWPWRLSSYLYRYTQTCCDCLVLHNLTAKLFLKHSYQN